MRVLISAYACEPGRGSEPGVGWNVAREAAKFHEVWVLTRPDESKEIIEAELKRDPVPNLHFVYFTLPFWENSLRWGQSGAMQIHYYLWQIQAFFVGRRLHRDIGFDVIHHVTFVKYSVPSFLSLLPVPFVWGPVGGGEIAPKAFWKDFTFSARCYEIARSVAHALGELDPFVRLTARKSLIIRATTPDTARQLYKLGAKDVEIIPEVALPEHEIKRFAQHPITDSTPIIFISMGRLLHWKGFHLGLRAFAAAKFSNAEYWVLGRGPEWDRLHALAENLGIAGKARFLGELPREKVLARLEESHVLVHPSLHDSGGWVCIEAMAAGRPVVCLNIGGPAVQITSETGFKIPANNPDQAVRDMGKAMVRLAQDPELRLRMGEAGRQLVRASFSWEIRGIQLGQLYWEIGNKKLK